MFSTLVEIRLDKKVTSPPGGGGEESYFSVGTQRNLTGLRKLNWPD